VGDSSVLSPNGRAILEQRYEGPSDQSPDDIFRRVASFIATAEDEAVRHHWERAFFHSMADLEFLPNSPTLRNAGTGMGCLSACYVIPIDDMMHNNDPAANFTGICDSATAAILVQKHGGGTGFSGARLRPRGDIIQTTHRAACGPVEVLKYLNAASNLVTQAAFRAGANMFILPVTHPDILEFINCKTENPEAISRFNISVAVTDDFMEAYKNDSDYGLVNPRTGLVVERLQARGVMRLIAEAACTTGDPGVFNIDLANRRNPDSHHCSIECTNPCAEQCLPPWGSCTLGSVDISKFVTGQGAFDVPRFRQTVKLGIRFLDDVVTVNTHPMPQIQHQAENDRRVGLDIMGWHDFLILQGIPYASDAGLAAAHHVGGIFQSAADEASEELAEERGAYPWFEGSPRQIRGGKPIRNSTRTNMAPTGTRSIIAGCSSGIEPRFGLANWRKYFDPAKQKFVTFQEPEVGRAFEAVAKANGFWSDRLLRGLADGITLQSAYWQITGEPLPIDTIELLATATEISPEWHIRIQAAWQQHVDNSISKTINMPSEAQPEDIEKAFVMALDLGCVSTTIYRDGSRANQILTNGRSPESTQTPPDDQGTQALIVAAVPHGEDQQPVLVATPSSHRRRLPNERNSITHKIQVADWDGYVTVGLYDDGTPGEIFMASKEGSTVGGLLDAWATSVSIGLQHGVPLSTLTKKFRSTHFEPSGLTQNSSIKTATSIVDYVGHWLEQKFLNGHLPEPEPTGMLCSDCGGRMILQMGCHVCEQCGNEKCG